LIFRVPDAVQRLFALRRRAGTHFLQMANKMDSPDQQRATPQAMVRRRRAPLLTVAVNNAATL
jgi:hypothetical protein